MVYTLLAIYADVYVVRLVTSSTCVTSISVKGAHRATGRDRAQYSRNGMTWCVHGESLSTSDHGLAAMREAFPTSEYLRCATWESALSIRGGVHAAVID